MTVFVFLIVHMVLGEPVRTMLGPQATQEAVDIGRHRLGLDRPLLDQYLPWFGGLGPRRPRPRPDERRDGIHPCRQPFAGHPSNSL